MSKYAYKYFHILAYFKGSDRSGPVENFVSGSTVIVTGRPKITDIMEHVMLKGKALDERIGESTVVRNRYSIFTLRTHIYRQIQ